MPTKKSSKNIAPIIILGVLLLLTIIYSIIITKYAIDNNKSHGDTIKIDCYQKLTQAPAIAKKLNGILESNNSVYYYGEKTVPSIVPLISATPQFQIGFNGKYIKKCEYHGNTFVYTGLCSFCNNIKNPPSTVPQLGFMGKCQVAFVLIIKQRNTNDYMVDFSFQYGQCSNEVAKGLDTNIQSLTYDMTSDKFILNIIIYKGALLPPGNITMNILSVNSSQAKCQNTPKDVSSNPVLPNCKLTF